MKKLSTFLLAFIAVVSLSAQPLAGGKYYVPKDPGTGDVFYTSLKAAFTAINDNGIDGDITLYINDDLLETENVGLINASNYTITIRPDADADRTITFSHAADDNAGPSGSLIVGIKMGLSWNDLVSTKNIIFNGYAEDGTTRRLKIETSDTHHVGNPPILLLNDCSDIEIKNMIIEHKGATGSTSGYGIYLRGQPSAASGTNAMPSNILIENNAITSNKNTASQGIGIYANAAPGAMATGVVIKDNTIKARTRGVFVNYVNGLDIISNEFYINQSASGVLSSVVMGNAGLTGDIKFDKNKILEMKTANIAAGASGIRGIIASGGGTWYISNNFFTGMQKTSTAAGETMLQMIRCGSTTHIIHNTFVLNELSNKPTYSDIPTDANGSYCAVNIAAGAPTIKNNIFISNEDAVPNFFIRGTVSGDVDNNVYYLRGGNTNARINLNYQTSYDNFTDYVNAYTGIDVNSQYADVTFADEAAGDLSIAGSSIQDATLAVSAITGYETDIFNKTRSATTYAGAHESDLPFVSTGTIQEQAKSFKVLRTPSGIKVELQGMSNIELYAANGALIERVRTDGTYTHDLNPGAYIIRINGKAEKFIR